MFEGNDHANITGEIPAQLVGNTIFDEGKVNSRPTGTDQIMYERPRPEIHILGLDKDRIILLVSCKDSTRMNDEAAEAGVIK
ncbi:hypothetical protein M0802_002692 [Mischocyttarus mexicanus]|nr:hypothetical protein M0802_002692 [Mischocyttarus mexicanus]